MENLEVIARLKIRPSELEAFDTLSAEIVRLTRERDSRTLRCDWFVNGDTSECEVHELFVDEHALVEHKMNTMEPSTELFRKCLVGHQATMYGHVSDEFIAFATERAGAPTVFRLTHRLESRPATKPDVVSGLQVIARLKVRDGKLDGFKRQVSEIVRLTEENDTKTIRYDWFINGAETECEVHELYVDEEGLVEHNHHVVEARDALFTDYAFDHHMSVYGEISARLRSLFDKHAGGVSTFSLAHGLAEATSV